MFNFNPFHKQPELTTSEKGLQGTLIYAEKTMTNMSHLADVNRVAANNLIMYGSSSGEDLMDVTGKIGRMLIQWSNVMMEFSESIEQYHDTMKTIAVKESGLQTSREQKRKVADSISKLEESHPGAVDRINSLKDQLTELETFTEPDEVEMGNFKRMATREALYLLLNGMHAFASKTDIISTFGKYVTDELPVAPIQVGDERPFYNGAEKTRKIEQDAKNALHHWNPDKRKMRRTLTSHHGRNPLTMSLKVNKQLPPKPKTLKNRLRKEKENEDKDEEQQEEKDEETENEVEDLDIDQGEEQQQEKPVSSRTTSLYQHSLYKPDEVDDIDQDSQVIPDSQSNISLPHATPSIYHPSPMIGGFSNVHLNEGLTNQQNLYQFYQQYIPPRTYEEMVGPAVFRGAMENKHDAGGFVLPFANPNFAPSPSNSSDRRLAPSPTSSSDRRSVSSRGELDRNDNHQ